jgi:hypothetical protein
MEEFKKTKKLKKRQPISSLVALPSTEPKKKRQGEELGFFITLSPNFWRQELVLMVELEFNLFYKNLNYNSNSRETIQRNQKIKEKGTKLELDCT